MNHRLSFFGGGGRRLQSSKLGATASQHKTSICIQPSPWCDPKSTSLQHPRFLQHPKNGAATLLTGLQPFPHKSSSTDVATNTCSSALKQVQQDTDTPQKTTFEFSLLFLLRITGEASAAEGTRKETAQSGRCLQFSCLTSLCSHHNTHTLLSKRNFTPCNTPSSFSNRSPPWCSVTCTSATSSKPPLPPLCWRWAAGHPLPV